MPDRRDQLSVDPDLKEDAGIFKGGVVDVAFEVTPLRKRTTRGDMLVMGFINGVGIEVIFPGRRRASTGPLLSRLDHLVRQANREAQQAKKPTPSMMQIRFPLKAQGTWRTRIHRDPHDIVERTHQLLVARWTMRDGAGIERTYGDPPVTLSAQDTRQP